MMEGAALSSRLMTGLQQAVTPTLRISVAQSTVTVEAQGSTAPVRPASTTGQLEGSVPASLLVGGSGQTGAVGRSSLCLTVSLVSVTGPQR